jgi:hypothetical protein
MWALGWGSDAWGSTTAPRLGSFRREVRCAHRRLRLLRVWHHLSCQSSSHFTVALRLKGPR